VLLVAEHGGAKRRAFWASWPQAGVPAGNLLAAGVLAVMAGTQSEADFLAWGWRIPFLLSAVLIAVGYWVRATVTESPVFAEARALAQDDKTRRSPALEVVRRRPGGLAIGAGLRVGENICYYVITAFSITYATTVVGVSRGVALNALLVGAAAECLTLPLFGMLADKIGRRPVYTLGAIGMAIWAFAFFRLLDTGMTAGIVAAMVGGLVLHGAMYGPQAAFIAELFPTSMRYSGASIAYQVTSVVAGSLAPIIALALFKQTGQAWPIAVYVAAACLISAISALMARETKGQTFEEIDAR
jgi:MFS family permease